MKYNWGFILTPLLKFIRQVSFVVYPLELFFQHDEKISWEISHNFLSLKLWKSIGKQIRKKIEILLTINFHVIIDESWWRRAYLNFNEKFIHSFMLLSINFIQLQLSLFCLTWHSYVASSIFCADSIFRRQLFGYWKSTEYLESPEYVVFPTVRSSRSFAPLFRRTHETYTISHVEKGMERKKLNCRWVDFLFCIIWHFSYFPSSFFWGGTHRFILQ